MTTRSYYRIVIPLLLTAFLLLTACQPVPVVQEPSADASMAQSTNTLTIYSGRSESLVAPLIEMYKEQSGVDVAVRYGGTSEMAATILEEGDNSPADVFFGQDAGALGALAEAGRCTTLPDSITGAVDPRFVSPDGQWIGVSGRARVLVYNTDELTEADLPASILDLTDEAWRGRVGWAPTNASFQAFITAMRVNLGEDETAAWIEGMIANEAQLYSENTAIVEAVGRGELPVGLVNHYYLFRFLAEDPSFPAANYYFPAGDIGSMINVAGVCELNTTAHSAEAQAFIEYLISPAAQQYFATQTNEYPLAIVDVELNPQIKPLAEIDTPEFDLGDIADLAGTLLLLQETGALN